MRRSIGERADPCSRWFAMAPATGLAVTDGFAVAAPVKGSNFMASPAGLPDRLDEALCLPSPRTGWDF